MPRGCPWGVDCPPASAGAARTRACGCSLEKVSMRSRKVWLAACAAAVSVLAACSSDDDPSSPVTNEQANRPGAAGAPGTTTTPATTPSNPAPTGGAETPPPPQRVSENNGAAAGSNSVDAGAGDAGAPADAGAVAAQDAGGTPPGNPPPGNGGNPPPPNPVGFSNVFQLLLDNCGTCHGANAPNNRPRFAQAGNQAASYAVTQANGVAANIIAEAVTARTMPPSCNRGALGTGTCLDANEAAQLQAWLAQGAQP